MLSQSHPQSNRIANPSTSIRLQLQQSLARLEKLSVVDITIVADLALSAL